MMGYASMALLLNIYRRLNRFVLQMARELSPQYDSMKPRIGRFFRRSLAYAVLYHSRAEQANIESLRIELLDESFFGEPLQRGRIVKLLWVGAFGLWISRR